MSSHHARAPTRLAVALGIAAGVAAVLGLCAAFCRRRRRRVRHHHGSVSERTPLLQAAAEPVNIREFSRKAVDIIAASKAGKLPSQDQLSRAVQLLLKSKILDEKEMDLSLQGQVLLKDVRRISELSLVFGLEKNHDDKIQDILFRATHLQRPQDAVAEVALDTAHELPNPHEFEHDIYTLVESARTLGHLFVSSTAFRVLLSTLAGIVQAGVVELAGDVTSAAGAVAAVADKVHHVAEDVEVAAEEVGVKVADELETSPAHVESIPHQVEEIAKEVVADVGDFNADSTVRKPHPVAVDTRETRNVHLAESLQAVTYEVCQKPEYAAAVTNVLELAQKYLDAAQNAEETVLEDTQAIAGAYSTEVKTLCSDLRTVLERLASGKSLDPTIDAFKAFLVEFQDTDSSIGILLDDLNMYIRKGSMDHAYPMSDAGKLAAVQLVEQAEDTYDSLKAENPAFSAFVDELQAFSAALKNDRNTTRVWDAAGGLLKDGEAYLGSLGGRARHLSEQLWRDALAVGWAVVKSVITLGAEREGTLVPLPRVEYTDGLVDVVVDPRLMRISAETDGASQSVVKPDSIVVKRWEEWRADFENDGTRVSNNSKIQARVEGLLHGGIVQLDDIQYYANVKGPVGVGYADEGVVGLDVVGGTGGSVDLTFTVHAANEEDGTPLKVEVESVKVDLPMSMGVVVELARTRHWILNWVLVNPLVLPLTGWIVKRTLQNVVQEYVRKGIEAVTGQVGEVAEGKKGVFAALIGLFSTEDSGEEDEEDEDSATQVHLVPTGVKIDLAGDDAGTLVVGVAPQLLPHHAEVQVADRLSEELERVEEGVAQKVNDVSEVIQDAGVAVAEVQEQISDAPERINQREQKAEAEDGWRSVLFDLS
ncbi:hypothetical protein CYLTODRAFT_422925 [Cylindrobasidium torrendii FP15055 ss-10]|uniref:HAM1-like N-terminal domain-containing protein n=1 Tax=Cylindrobasidium torrendii FP15055 ss-10 TaxID=1314674 RepID=A0A0D7BBU5_9AGAR|nr:hypothetical protein CYLTODRAFT_422925 [Cylindrobasidium torrendii FP15055 ss-10]